MVPLRQEDWRQLHTSPPCSYDEGVGEMRELLARGRPLDELWAVANSSIKVWGDDAWNVWSRSRRGRHYHVACCSSEWGGRTCPLLDRHNPSSSSHLLTPPHTSSHLMQYDEYISKHLGISPKAGKAHAATAAASSPPSALGPPPEELVAVQVRCGGQEVGTGRLQPHRSFCTNHSPLND